MNWWELPGPSAFVQTAENDVREGKSVFLQLPEHCPKGLAVSIRQALGEDLPWFSTTVDEHTLPINFLYDLLVPKSDPAILRSPRTLVVEPDFQRYVIWVEGLSDAAWNAWSEFFVAYDRASRSVHPARRTQFLVPMYGQIGSLKAPEALGISQHRWDGWLRYGDMLFYSCSCVGERTTPIETELAIALVAELAQWDPELCEWLAQFSIEKLIRPQDILRGFSENRGWKLKTERLKEDAWRMGASYTVKEKSVLHSCLSSAPELEKLIWKAEVAVLMPYIEEQRQLLLRKYGRCLHLPFMSASGEQIDDMFDLEIGHIEWRLVGCPGVKRDEMLWVSALKDARNSLSHLEPVDGRVLALLLQSAE